MKPRLTRRSLFAMIPAASAVMALRSGAAPLPKNAVNAAGFGVSVQCWSFREFTLFEAIAKAAEAGAAGVEVYRGQKLGGDHGDAEFSPELSDAQIGSVREQLKKHGMAAFNYGVVDIPKEEAEARKTFELAKKLDLYGVTTESLGSIDTLEKLAAEYGVKVCFHNHPKPTPLWDPQKIWDALKGRHENLGYCADVGHWATSGLDPAEVIRKIAPRVHAFHLKDREVVGKHSTDRPFGTGVLDIPAMLDEVRKHGFAGNVTIEYETNWQNNVPDIAQCVGYLRAYARLRA